jgi:hypothetical protein
VWCSVVWCGDDNGGNGGDDDCGYDEDQYDVMGQIVWDKR